MREGTVVLAGPGGSNGHLEDFLSGVGRREPPLGEEKFGMTKWRFFKSVRKMTHIILV